MSGKKNEMNCMDQIEIFERYLVQIQNFDIMTNHEAIYHTKKWINNIVIGLNLCPFAAREMKRNTISYLVESGVDIEMCLLKVLEEFRRMSDDPSNETSFIIFTNAFNNFLDYLDFVNAAESLLRKNRYTGIYQLASFHPRYIFEGSDNNDPANYTNRSPFPMLHILREESIEKSLENFPNPELIPEKNIQLTRSRGIAYMRALFENCKNDLL